MVLVFEVHPPGTDPAFGQGTVLVAIRLSKAIKVPAERISFPNDHNPNTLAWTQVKGLRGLQDTVSEFGIDRPHAAFKSRLGAV